MALTLETFDGEDPADRPAGSDDTLEELRLAAYEQGYSAGWEDATKAGSEDQARIGEDLARHLQSLGFTYQEARTHVLRAVEPLLQEMVTRLLPEIAREAIGPVVTAQLMPLAESHGDAPITLTLHPKVRAAIAPRLEVAHGLTLDVVEDNSLDEGQAYFRMGEVESRVDLTRATARITAAVRGFFDLSRLSSQAADSPPTPERAHG